MFRLIFAFTCKLALPAFLFFRKLYLFTNLGNFFYPLEQNLDILQQQDALYKV